jgi:hypothetical protein
VKYRLGPQNADRKRRLKMQATETINQELTCLT